MYFHPWEIDPHQPHLTSGIVSRLRTYTGIAAMYSKIDRLLKDFSFGTMTDVYNNEIAPHCTVQVQSNRSEFIKTNKLKPFSYFLYVLPLGSAATQSTFEVQGSASMRTR